MGDSFAGMNDTIGALVNYGKAFIIQTARLGRHNPQTGRKCRSKGRQG